MKTTTIALLGGLGLAAALLYKSTRTAAKATPAKPGTSIDTPPTLHKGSRGTDVVTLQSALSMLGYYVGAADGIYGVATAAAVKDFQSAQGLSVDGIAGPLTWGALGRALDAV